jgi:hypothetical protein
MRHFFVGTTFITLEDKTKSMKSLSQSFLLYLNTVSHNVHSIKILPRPSTDRQGNVSCKTLIPICTEEGRPAIG